eukprot:TRINITY_DN15066_c0_g1_i1.p2 TRINITY_DN15066_c0_g1~~TRINITY_DN15066_c0_g1_i1.p2  ORF type:complete len:154 (+),score=38.60 TRINITY_DN15066_c0_g1_i1:133-594(+)
MGRKARDRSESSDESDDRGKDRKRAGGKEEKRAPAKERKSRSRSRGRGGGGGRDKGRSRSAERKTGGGKRGRSSSSDSRSSEDEDEMQEFLINNDMPEDQMLVKMMGFSAFDSTKGKDHSGSDLSDVKRATKRQYRQYMNRRGGFNRPLDAAF